MSVDRISNLVSAIKNASMVGKKSVVLPYTGTCESIAKVLLEAGFIAEIKTFKEKGKSFKHIRLDIAYDDYGAPKLTDIKRVSKPGKRVYTPHDKLSPVAGGHGLTIVSTSRGLTTGLDARKRKLGGEVLLRAW